MTTAFSALWARRRSVSMVIMWNLISKPSKSIHQSTSSTFCFPHLAWLFPFWLRRQHVLKACKRLRSSPLAATCSTGVRAPKSTKRSLYSSLPANVTSMAISACCSPALFVARSSPMVFSMPPPMSSPPTNFFWFSTFVMRPASVVAASRRSLRSALVRCWAFARAPPSPG